MWFLGQSLLVETRLRHVVVENRDTSLHFLGTRAGRFRNAYRTCPTAGSSVRRPPRYRFLRDRLLRRSRHSRLARASASKAHVLGLTPIGRGRDLGQYLSQLRESVDRAANIPGGVVRGCPPTGQPLFLSRDQRDGCHFLTAINAPHLAWTQ